MKQNKSSYIFLILVVTFLVIFPVNAKADQAQYFYDELGRLVGVVDGNGDLAVYTYDEVGNLLSITRPGQGGGTIGFFLMAPASGLVGTSVTLQGFGFSAVAADNQVDFNGTSATVLSSTSNTLEVTVPTGASTGSVTVTNSNGTATSPNPFTVLVPPIIVDIAPGSFVQGATSQAIIGGFNLANATAVTFTQSGLTASIIPGATEQDLTINLTVDASVPVGSYPFAVVTPGGTAQSGTITLAVSGAEPTFSAGPPVSILMPLPETVAPQGPTMSITPLVSVEMP